ncbi:MAG: excisionase family DNA-binding protein [Acidobacteriota bacterium]|nr:excisionase family DNA-binding protein [Acidobacteriota bacterium]
MEATQGYPNLLSEKQAAARLGVARITLLRAREAGRIRFFRVGTRVLYCEEQLAEFLKSCERNGGKPDDGLESEAARKTARRKDNRVSSLRRSVPAREAATVDSATESAKVDQASLPFLATR